MLIKRQVNLQVASGGGQPMSEGEIPRQINAILDVLGLQWTSLFDESDNEKAGARRDKVVTWLYRILDTLDNKTGHVLRSTALLLTAQTFLASILVRDSQTPRWISRTVLLLLLFPLFPPVVGLPIFWVKWKFFEKVRGKKADNYDKEKIKEEIWGLAKVCDKRVTFHHSTVVLCYVCILAFILTLVFAIKVIAPFCLCLR
jgi:hypothetical protein